LVGAPRSGSQQRLEWKLGARRVGLGPVSGPKSADNCTTLVDDGCNPNNQACLPRVCSRVSVVACALCLGSPRRGRARGHAPSASGGGLLDAAEARRPTPVSLERPVFLLAQRTWAWECRSPVVRAVLVFLMHHRTRCEVVAPHTLLNEAHQKFRSDNKHRHRCRRAHGLVRLVCSLSRSHVPVDTILQGYYTIVQGPLRALFGTSSPTTAGATTKLLGQPRKTTSRKRV